MPAPITPQDFSEIRWCGHWIWMPEEQIAHSEFVRRALIHGQSRELPAGRHELAAS